MENFKVICKASGSGWEILPSRTKLVVKCKLFGLIKSSSVVNDPYLVPGPDKEEICIVHEIYPNNGDIYYKLLGYPYGGYNSKYFIRLGEIEEASKEIAQKADLQTN